MQIEDRIRIGRLLGEYGGLLTEKQRTMLNEYCGLDLSLCEIAEQYGITRQAVRDAIRRAVFQLEEYERVLQTIEFKNKLRKKLEKLEAGAACCKELAVIKEMLEE
jgi:predicted DNA-binding protein YlxM (UPF0122 family)